MDSSVPYMNSIKNVPKMLDAFQNAGVPEVFNKDFLVDLGFKSSYDRSMIKVLKYLGFLDSSNRPQDSYRRFVDHTQSRAVLANSIRSAFDDLYLADQRAHEKTRNDLAGWFKTKTGSGDAVAKKIATTFKALADYADFSQVSNEAGEQEAPEMAARTTAPPAEQSHQTAAPSNQASMLEVGLVNRFEIHLPDTQNVETFRAIFRALREELLS